MTNWLRVIGRECVFRLVLAAGLLVTGEAALALRMYLYHY